MKNPPSIVECFHLVTADFCAAPDNTVIVKTQKASNYRVVRERPGIFVVYSSEFRGGYRVVRGIDAVRDLLMTR